MFCSCLSWRYRCVRARPAPNPPLPCIYIATTPPLWQFAANALFLSDLWIYVGVIANDSASASVALAPDAPFPASQQLSRWGVLWGSWWLLAFAFINTFGLGFALFMLLSHFRLAMVNLTTNEVRGSYCGDN